MMGTKAISAIDQSRIDQFRKLITVQADATLVRKALTKLFIQYARLLNITPEEDFSRDERETEDGLYFLSELITLLDEPQ